MGLDADDLSYIDDEIQKLQAKGTLPSVGLKAEEVLYRVQDAAHLNAEHFGVPTENLGRYNDPECKRGVLYGAQDPEGALGETFCRTRSDGPLRGRKGYIQHSDLSTRNMAIVRTTRDLVLLDISKALPKLKMSIDLIAGTDYKPTQQVVSTLLNLPGQPYDGIAYHSRHYQNGKFCVALWEREGSEKPVKTEKLELLSDFSVPSEDPDGTVSTMDTEEILTEVLGFKVM